MSKLTGFVPDNGVSKIKGMNIKHCFFFKCQMYLAQNTRKGTVAHSLLYIRLQFLFAHVI